MQITDKAIYRTTVWTVETESDTYHVTCQEGELHDSWHIVGDMSGVVENGTELGYELIQLCEFWDDAE
jgi:hypothetical protein